MRDLVTTQPAYAHAEGVMRIDVGQVLGRLCDAASHGPLDRYLAACAAVQFWADLLAIGKSAPVTIPSEQQIDASLRHAEREADCAARALLRRDTAASAIANAHGFAYIRLNGDSALMSMRKLLHLPMPECCGYDLADLETIAGDGKRLIDQVGLNRPILIVGIRTGGTYLAPLWKAVLTTLGVTDARWCTIRPPYAQESRNPHTDAGVQLDRQSTPIVVVVDDQPDTGATMQQAAAQWRAPGVDLWFACVGRLWRDSTAFPLLAHSPASVVHTRRDRPLWAYLLPDDHPEFMARLRRVLGLPSLPHGARLQFRCPHGEARYGSGCAWLPWNDPRILSGRRSLINPRKTPVAVCELDGRALLHFRFLGEGIFGRAEFQRVRQIDLTRRPAWFVDGYAITPDIGTTVPFTERFRAAGPSGRTDLLAQAAHWLIALTKPVIAQACGRPLSAGLATRWMATFDALQACGVSLPEVPEPLAEFLIRPVPWLGHTGKAIRSSLRYACGGWHWQVDDQGQLHRFQLDANWGDVSFPELELAAFALENRLTSTEASHLASLCGLPYSSVRESVSPAALIIAEARVKSVRKPSDLGRIAMREDLRDLLITTSELAQVDTTY